MTAFSDLFTGLRKKKGRKGKEKQMFSWDKKVTFFFIFLIFVFKILQRCVVFRKL